MKDFVEYLAKHLVDSPDEVEVKEIESDRTVIYEVSVADDDMGKIIGKNGQTVNAIRTLLTAASAKKGGKRAMLELND
ncbi:MAG: KH domain-containing protein [Candidatus Marinimicrobia bacterium]|nr:KH domain-containing protein [Candidatus Neomarinimicrobiota bacterium]MCF7827545.1 KH domain-containing protein [Candidatus Neomarinimicrobiota bacterium]MCF7881593.1 KH domain-containing protein [Candidatus Neomarinimicrobiota bacterium]